MGSLNHMQRLVAELQELEDRLRQGGGASKIQKQHRDGKLTARERIAKLIDLGSPWLETGLLVAHDQYEGQAPGAGVVTGLGRIEGRPAVVVANDATVKAGAWWPETIQKMLRAQEIAMRHRLPIVYLVDSAGVNLPLQDGIFPGTYGAARIFHYNSLMRRRLKIPQIAAVMGPCIAGGAYLPALSDVIIMVDKTSFMGLGGPNLVKGAIGLNSDAESIGGARMHTEVSGVAHYRAENDEECLQQIRARFRDLPESSAPGRGTPARKPAEDLYSILPEDHRLPYDMEEILDRLLDGDDQSDFQPDYAPEMICRTARWQGSKVAVIANRRGLLKRGGAPRIGGIVYTESARKVAYFVDMADRLGLPLVYLQDVSGFMVGPEAEASGIIRAGAEMVETMACASVPKIILTLNHASGAGYYAMAGQGFDPSFTFAWPTARIGVMEGDSAIVAVYGAPYESLPGETQAKAMQTRADYEKWLDVRHAAARGHVDAVLDPLETRRCIAFALECVRTAEVKENRSRI